MGKPGYERRDGAIDVYCGELAGVAKYLVEHDGVSRDRDALTLRLTEIASDADSYPPPPWVELSGDEFDGVVAQAVTRTLLALRNGAEPANGVQPKKKKIPGKRANMFPPEKVEWLWRGYIPLGKLSDLQGDPGQGKSVVTATLAAIVTRGWEFPTGDRCEAAGVVMVSAEDGPRDTIRPRLEVAGADLKRIHLFTLEDDDLLSLPEDIEILRTAIGQVSARLMILDPLDAFITDEINANQNQSIRKLLARLAKLAAETGCSVMVVRHLNKDAKTSNPMYRGGGSIGLNAASRQVLLIGAAPDDPTLHVLAPVKENLGPLSASIGYRIVGATLADHPEIETAKLEWVGVVPYTARQLLQEPAAEEGPARGRPSVKGPQVMEKMREILSDGWAHDADEVEAEIRAALGNVSKGTIWNARRDLGVKAHKKGFSGTWSWALPAENQTEEVF